MSSPLHAQLMIPALFFCFRSLSFFDCRIFWLQFYVTFSSLPFSTTIDDDEIDISGLAAAAAASAALE